MACPYGGFFHTFQAQGGCKDGFLQPCREPPGADRSRVARQSRWRNSCQEVMPTGRTICTFTFLGDESEACTRALSRCRASA